VLTARWDVPRHAEPDRDHHDRQQRPGQGLDQLDQQQRSVQQYLDQEQLARSGSTDAQLTAGPGRLQVAGTGHRGPASVSWLLGPGAVIVTACIHPDHHASAGVAARAGLTVTDDVIDGERGWRLASGAPDGRPG
jgi:hypothetical protein